MLGTQPTLRERRYDSPRPAAVRDAGTTLDLKTLGPELAALASSDVTPESRHDRLVALACRLMNAHAAVLAKRDATGSWRIVALATSETHDPSREAWQATLLATVEATAMTGGLHVARLADGFVSAGAVAAGSAPEYVLAVVLQVGAGAVEPFLVALQLLTGYAVAWPALAAGRASEQEAATAAALLELLARVSAASDLATAAHVVVATLVTHLGAERAALGLISAGSAHCRPLAVSDVAEFCEAADTTQRLSAALQETAQAQDLLVWPSATQPAPALAALAAHFNAAVVIGLPLRDDQGTASGALLLWGEQEAILQSTTQAFLHAAGPGVTHALRLHERASAPGWIQTARKISADRWWARPRVLTLAAATLAGMLCMPWPYRVACDCELQPVVRQYVAAPYDGVFEKSLVKPGDVVERDQVLGRMDGREIRWQLAGIEADQSRAGKSRDVNMAATKTAAAQIDALEVQRLEQQRRLFEHRAAHLEIRSPIDGLVIAGDLQRSEGVPLTVGQTLYEVAPLGQMVAEVLVPDDDALHVTIGQEVRLRLDAQPSRELRGRIDRLTPRAEVRDDANVFVAEVVLVGDDPALRPGMKGRARISTEWHPLGWNWFHKPAGQLAAWLGW